MSWLLSSAGRQVDLHGGGVAGLKAEVDIEDAKEAAQQQAGADEEDAGQGDLRDDQGGAEALMAAACGHACRVVFDRS